MRKGLQYIFTCKTKLGFPVFLLFLSLNNYVYASSTLDASTTAKDTTQPISEEYLPEVEIRAFESERSLLQQAAGIESLGPADFEAFGSRSLSNAINSRPGVRLEQRAPSSYRVSIRGSSLRAPFGVRNVKVYWNDLPLTLSDGTTALNILDVAATDEIDILKGPAGSIYGAGNGGVLKFSNRLSDEGSRLTAQTATGSFDMFRLGLKKSGATDDMQYTAGLHHFQSDGHREHSRTERTVFNFSGRWFPTANQPVGFHILYSDLFYQIPGGLTLGQFEEDPYQSRPGSIEQNSSIRQRTLLTGFTMERNLGNNITNSSSVFLSNTDFDHPFILDYKKDLGTDYGARTVFRKDAMLAGLPLRLVLGAEFQQGRVAARNFGNKEGLRDTMRFSDDIRTRNYFFYTQAEVELNSDWLLTLGLSRNTVGYKVDRNVDNLSGTPFSVSRNFQAEWVPRIAASYKFNETSSMFASVSAGFSPPTLDEFRTNEGSLNEDLEAERGLNFELGYRGIMPQRGVEWDLSTFYYRLSESISTFTNEEGVVLFRNSGGTNQFGVEFSLNYPLLRTSDNQFLSGIQLKHTYTGHFFYFRDQIFGQFDLSGNYLTGVAPHSAFNELNFGFFGSGSLHLQHRYSDRLPLTDENTEFQSSWNIFSLRFNYGFQTGFADKTFLSAGMDNVFDTIYSLGNDLNAFGGRYYQTAAGRNWDISLRIEI
ncbi:MAG: TonB-dependent receptor [Saprospirales bacterium]|nr:MAG: TonB-dependent receptor [Saprospirales bacterium]